MVDRTREGEKARGLRVWCCDRGWFGSRPVDNYANGVGELLGSSGWV